MRSGRAARIRLGTVGLFVVALLLGCQPHAWTTHDASHEASPTWSPDVRQGTGGPAPIMVAKSSILHSVLAAHGEALADTFARRMTFVSALPAPAVPALQLEGTVQNTYIYTSYATFAAALAGGRLPSTVHAVLYDIEKWPATPLIEQQHPQAYMLRFSALARAHGLLPVLAPARDLALVPGGSCAKQGGENLTRAYLRCGLATADAQAAALVVQSQAAEFNVVSYRHFVARAARQARARNPRIAVLAQLATAPLNRPASVRQLVAAARSVRGLVQGFSVTARQIDTETTAGLLWALGPPGAKAG